jgi:hypothetical protein
MKRRWSIKLDCGHELLLSGSLSTNPVHRALYCGTCRENRLAIKYGWTEVKT